MESKEAPLHHYGLAPWPKAAIPESEPLLRFIGSNYQSRRIFLDEFPRIFILASVIASKFEFRNGSPAIQIRLPDNRTKQLQSNWSIESGSNGPAIVAFVEECHRTNTDPICVASAVKWPQRLRATGTAASGKMGGHRKVLLEPGEIIAVDLHRARLDKALEIGATDAIDASAVEVFDAVADLTGVEEGYQGKSALGSNCHDLSDGKSAAQMLRQYIRISPTPT